jgi:hypothetical protein
MSDKKEITIFTGTHIWKSGLEYHNEHTFLHGFPYFQITGVDDVYYLWELDLDDADRRSYRIIKKSDDFGLLHEEGMELADALGKKYDEKHLYYTYGKELIKKLKGEA